MKTENKIALVTGGSRGLGKDMALRLAERKNDVIITYKSNQQEADNVVQQIKALGQQAVALQLDVADSGQLASFTEGFATVLQHHFATDHIDYLINNAGIGIHASFEDTSMEQFDLLMAIHLKAPFFLTQRLLPYLNEGGGIVNVSTGLTRFANPRLAAYAAMKGAMEVLTIYQAKELGARKIRVNVIAPGAIETDFGGGLVRDNEQVNQLVVANTALGRVGQADDIGSVVAFLCSDDAKWVNAQRIEISGGQQI